MLVYISYKKYVKTPISHKILIYNLQIEITNFQHPLPNRVPYKNFSYSDHEAVMATLKFTSGK